MGERTYISRRGKTIRWDEPYPNAPIPPEIQAQIDYENSNLLVDYVFGIGIGGDRQETVNDMIDTLPPDPEPGSRYIYTGTGEFHNHIIMYDYVEYPKGQDPIGTWLVTPPEVGMDTWVTAKGNKYHYNGSDWVVSVPPVPPDVMLKSVYDTDDDGIVDKSESIDDGEGNQASASDIVDAVAKRHERNYDEALRNGKLSVDPWGHTTILGELRIKVYVQELVPTLNDDEFMAIWVKPSKDRIQLIYQVSGTDTRGVELGKLK